MLIVSYSDIESGVLIPQKKIIAGGYMQGSSATSLVEFDTRIRPAE